jgi:hypothetical protein
MAVTTILASRDVVINEFVGCNRRSAVITTHAVCCRKIVRSRTVAASGGEIATGDEPDDARMMPGRRRAAAGPL